MNLEHLHPTSNQPEPHLQNDYHLPLDPKSWSRPPGINAAGEAFQNTLCEVAGRWKYLAPFFQSHGYYLYQWRFGISTIPSQVIPSPINPDQLDAYPYGRRPDSLTCDIDYEFLGTEAFRLWAARDQLGREVLIRLVSFPDEESEELKIYRRLNTPEARKDPRNHTVPVLSWLEYSGLTFLVFPRWGDPLIGTCYFRAEQILLYADTLLEGLTFLHENRIAHRDIDPRNTVANVLSGAPRLNDAEAFKLLHLSVARFAYIDFDAAVIFPMDAAIEEVVLEREMCLGVCDLRLPRGPSNPFNDDVVVLLSVLQRCTRVLEDEIPQFGPLFDGYLKDLSPPPAAVVLEAFRRLCSGLTQGQLDHVPKKRVWKSAAQQLRDELRRQKAREQREQRKQGGETQQKSGH